MTDAICPRCYSEYKVKPRHNIEDMIDTGRAGMNRYLCKPHHAGWIRQKKEAKKRAKLIAAGAV